MNINQYAELQHMSPKERINAISKDIKKHVKKEMFNDDKPSAEQIIDGMSTGKTYILSFEEQMILGEEFTVILKQYKDNRLLQFKVERVLNFMAGNFQIELNVLFTKKIKDVIGLSEQISKHVGDNKLMKFTRKLKTIK